MKKLTTAKIWQFAAGQFGWALLSGIISNWLVYFYQPDETAISQGQTVFIPQGLVIFGVFTIIGGITAFGRIFDAFTDPMIASWSDRCTSKNGRRIPFLKGAALPLALSTVLVFWSPANENSWINAAFLFVISGCPVCAGKRREKGVNDLESLYPEIAVEWDVKKNGGITPDQIGPGAHKKYWWICPVGHSYQAAPENRTKIRGTSCPICAKERQTSFPEQCIYFYFKKQYPQTENRYQLEGKELDIYIPELKAGIEYDGKRFHTNREKERKKDLFFQKKGIRVIRIKEYEGEKPQEEKDIIWIREKDNLFNNLSFAIRQVCYLLTGDLNVEIIDFEEKRTEIWNLYCFSIKENSIAARHPEFLKEWNCEKNGKLKPEQISYGSGKKVWWVCKKGHEYQMAPCARAKGAGCPICAGQRLLSGYNDLQTRYPEIAKEWDEEKNGGLQPSQVMPGTVKRVWWKCERNHSYMTTVASRTNAKSGCPYCSGRKAICGENDLFTIFPKLEREWDVEKNKDVDPRGMSPYTHRKVWWICPKGHSYLSAVSNRTKNMAKTNGNGCPYCSGQKVLSGFNDLQTRYPMIAAMWHPAKNGEIQSNMVAPYSTQKAWWIDWNGREVYRRIDSMVAMAKKRIYLE